MLALQLDFGRIALAVAVAVRVAVPEMIEEQVELFGWRGRSLAQRFGFDLEGVVCARRLCVCQNSTESDRLSLRLGFQTGKHARRLSRAAFG